MSAAGPCRLIAAGGHGAQPLWFEKASPNGIAAAIPGLAWSFERLLYRLPALQLSSDRLSHARWFNIVNLQLFSHNDTPALHQNW
jgi:hypothetical protein